MHLAILVTNTDDSAFAKSRPLDDAKFATLIAEARPDWTTQAFWVCRGEFPERLSRFDGVMITGSPDSVNSPADWKDRLQALIREVLTARQPLFGACFGHQAIAAALGVPVIRSAGWAHGALDVRRTGRAPWSGSEPRLRLYGSHIEQIAHLPDSALSLFESPGCPHAGFAIGSKVFTIQHHPEMTQEFIADLVEEYADVVGPEVTQTARETLSTQADRTAFAEELARFFEHAHRSE
ncbi:MAG: type 1 glutamine amidotransferase [Pseudomonadota bacterium]